ncbi:hypothetical protein RG47T_2920 [Mucilaginibacter polytrichastri]|uniref:Uncharacterized protein n=2 Tax=Mucilaginibacter polytrichastri TaxID=1302689 RepID=A0A1Q6A0B3_9SPHI|nr:hypothetical protein RG47T_2920 [Mucilaginibacter polytrichastri]
MFIKSTIITEVALILMIGFTAAPAFSQKNPIRMGSHSFSIQWISFNKANAGAVMIKPLGRGKYSIEGEQRDKRKNDYVTIKGSFEVAGSQLYFNGKIVSRVSYINNGKPCESNGPSVFNASGKRKYWRLQQMLNCDGISTDYIDIFF